MEPLVGNIGRVIEMAALATGGAEQEELESPPKRVKVDVQSFIDATNEEYERVHLLFEGRVNWYLISATGWIITCSCRPILGH